VTLVSVGMAIVTDLDSSLEGQREWESNRERERGKTTKTRGDCASYDEGTASLCAASLRDAVTKRNKVF